MAKDQHRHDISDRVWSVLEPLLPGRKGAWGGVAEDNRKFLNAVLWILRTGAPWRDLPEDYGGWGNTHRRFCRWRDKGHWERLLSELMNEPDFEWLMIDASHVKIHPHAAGARGGNEAIGLTKGGGNTKLHLAVDAHGMPVRVIVTAGSTADCTQAGRLIEGIAADHLIADKGYDTNAIIEMAQAAGICPQIPPKTNRIEQREYDPYLYRIRHLVENAFLRLKQWRGIATRYAKRASSFLAAVQFRCAILWASIS
ncbi:IS5 family transposase [Geminisphaera colitermitum]|uniref:IS5 family transposase n=1 Tax=Geminisphaera colitermitum TaxID=1148786 RepID=UPI000B496B82|nr:IS5 family transposase [Geminisphaera colitermitum]